MNQYPQSPGFKTSHPETSVVAATHESSRAATLRSAVLGCLSSHELTADECAHMLEQSILSIRPRLSELRAMGRIYDTGKRRQNQSGHKAAVWKAGTLAQGSLL